MKSLPGVRDPACFEMTEMSTAIDLVLIDQVEQERRMLADKLGFITEEMVISLAKASPKTVEDWRKRGNGPTHIRFGNAYFYEISDVMEYMKSLKKERNSDAVYRSI